MGADKNTAQGDMAASMSGGFGSQTFKLRVSLAATDERMDGSGGSERGLCRIAIWKTQSKQTNGAGKRQIR